MRLSPRLAACLAALAVAAAAASDVAAQAVPALREHRWQRRVLVVLAPGRRVAGGVHLPGAARRELARAAALLAERDVLVLDVAADTGRGRALRRQLGVPAGAFAAVSRGKDGGVKLRRRTLLSADVVLSTIARCPWAPRKCAGAAARAERAAGGRRRGQRASAARAPADQADGEPHHQQRSTTHQQHPARDRFRS
jgi:hypothetical protein